MWVEGWDAADVLGKVGDDLDASNHLQSGSRAL